MKPSGPVWKRNNYKSQDEYAAACRGNRKTKLAALAATECKNAALDILRIIWDKVEFDKPICKITKQQIMAEKRCSLKTVKQALADLRAEGSIKPINIKGGRGVPATYQLCVANCKTSPSEKATREMMQKRDRDATWRYLSGKYGAIKALEMMEEENE